MELKKNFFTTFIIRRKLGYGMKENYIIAEARTKKNLPNVKTKIVFKCDSVKNDRGFMSICRYIFTSTT